MNEVIVLRNVLRTTYVWDGFRDELREIIRKAKENNDILDVAMCRFGPDCIYLIEQENETGTLNIINSSEPLLDEILKHNRQAFMLTNGLTQSRIKKERIWLDFEREGDKSLNALLTKIRDSSLDTVWYAEATQKGFNENYDTVMALLNMVFYKRLFDVSTKVQRLTAIFKTYKSVLDPIDLLDENVFWYIMGGNYAVRVEADYTGLITIPGLGSFAKDKFITNVGVIPYWIGTESIARDKRRLEISDRLTKRIMNVEMIARASNRNSILGLIKQYGEY